MTLTHYQYPAHITSLLIMKKTLIIFLIAILGIAPVAAQRTKVTDAEREQAVMRTYDLLNSGHWVMVIDNITTTSYSYSQLIATNNYILLSDSLLTIQVDTSGANVQTNLTKSQKEAAESMEYWHPDQLDAKRMTQRDYRNVVKVETETNRRGTQVVHKLFLSTPDSPNSRVYSRLIIDPITLQANFGIFSGHLMPADEAQIVNLQPRTTDVQQRTIDHANGIGGYTAEEMKQQRCAFKVIAGYNYTYSINSLRIPETIDKILEPYASSFEIGVGIDYHAPKWAEGLAMQVALTYSPLRISDDNPITVRARKPTGTGYREQTKPWQCRGDQLNLTFGAQYTFGTGRVRPLIRAGAVVRYYVNGVFGHKTDYAGMYKVTDDRFYFGFNPGLQAGAYVGTGCLFDLGRHTLGLHLDAALDRAGLSAEFAF